MNPMPFWKLQSTGNDFVLVRHEDVVRSAAESGAGVEDFLRDLAIRTCARRFGVGADGLLEVALERPDLIMRMFNPDGTEDFCGNGLRCAAWHAYRSGWLSGTFVIRHGGQAVTAEILPDERIRTIFGQASYDPEKVPVSSTIELFNRSVWSGMDAGMPMNLFGSALTTGSTHVVLPSDSLPDEETFQSISPRIENDLRFPKRTSVVWSRVVEPMTLQIRIWERGAGETLGCGTGSSAAAADYLRRLGRGGTVKVLNPGGVIEVAMDAWDSPIATTGTAAEVFEGELT